MNCSVKRRVVLEVDRKKIASNYFCIKNIVGQAEVMCVLKADGYGLGARNCAQVLFELGCRRFAVADSVEAKDLVDFFKPSDNVVVQIVSSVLDWEIPLMVEKGVVLPVFDLNTAKLISDVAIKLGRKAIVHFKVDTGMGRLGATLDEATTILSEIIKLPSLYVEGAFSHLSSAGDADDETTMKQIESFKAFLEAAKSLDIKFEKLHIAATDAILNFPEAIKAPFNLVRTGIGLHGGFSDAATKVGLKSVFEFKSYVMQVRHLPAGAVIGYSHTAKLSRDSIVAIIAVGYADGVPLSLSNKGFVLVGGKKCPILGRVSMDYTAIDVTDVPLVTLGDEVVLLGSSSSCSITPDDWAEIKGVHPYEIMTSIGKRTQRCMR
ncbi:MAG: alanine racemase [Kiritimatiellae bacterium]|nr:alanine racemase [Kiritimatiellia bacterium]